MTPIIKTPNKYRDDILTYREMCDAEKVQTLQRGMNFRLNPAYTVVLMSQRSNAPYNDRIAEDGITIEYEGHDVPRTEYLHNPKLDNQSAHYPSGKDTQNGLFIKAIEKYKQGINPAEPVKIYEKILPGIWSLKGIFDLINYKKIHDGRRNVFRFTLRLSKKSLLNIPNREKILQHTRVIPSHVKKEVWMRDKGRCVLCNSTENLHFDHDLPFSKGGTSLTAKNIRLLCMKHNLEKSAKII